MAHTHITQRFTLETLNQEKTSLPWCRTFGKSNSEWAQKKEKQHVGEKVGKQLGPIRVLG
jgi:hypothetical protein